MATTQHPQPGESVAVSSHASLPQRAPRDLFVQDGDQYVVRTVQVGIGAVTIDDVVAVARYDAPIALTDDSRAEVAVLKAVAAHFVMFSGERDGEYAHQRAVVADLVSWFAADPEGRLDADLSADLALAADDTARLRVVVDQVAGLTDVRALALHAAHC